MDISDVTKDLTSSENFRIARRLSDMIRTNPNYRNLSAANRELILDLIEKYKEKIRIGLKPSLTTVREDKYYLYENRIRLGLTPYDLEQINKLLDSFKS